MTTVAFLLLPGVQLMDLAGPAQVFSTATSLGQPYELRYVAAESTVTSAQDLILHTETALLPLKADDLLVVPGWRAKQLGDTPPVPDQFRAALLDHHRRGGTVASVCAGADALGQAGLLDGRRCTTHHEHQDELARRYPTATVVRDVLFTEDDRVVTSAGIASGVDLALHLLAQRHGPRLAAQVGRVMVVYTRRNGASAQQSPMLRHRVHIVDQIHQAQDVIEQRFAQTLTLVELARPLGLSPRTLTRRFVAATGITPLRYQQLLRTERAQSLLDQGSSVHAAAQAVGLADGRSLRRLRAGNRA